MILLLRQLMLPNISFRMEPEVSQKYGDKFYTKRNEDTVYAANLILSEILNYCDDLESAIDFGCGVGTWLAVLKTLDVRDVKGLDGSWVKEDMLEIKKEEFEKVDFEKPVVLDRKYDIAISLEVAEHLSCESAEAFVASLTKASDLVLFSAAIPNQGGIRHLNEQWPDYWANMFEKHDYECYDFLRLKIWNDDKIPPWYKQNSLIFCRRGCNKNQIPQQHRSTRTDEIRRMVHPATLSARKNEIDALKKKIASLEQERIPVFSRIRNKIRKLR